MDGPHGLSNCPAAETDQPNPTEPPSKLLLTNAVDVPVPTATNVTVPPPHGRVSDGVGVIVTPQGQGIPHTAPQSIPVSDPFCMPS